MTRAEAEDPLLCKCHASDPLPAFQKPAALADRREVTFPSGAEATSSRKP